MPMLTKQNNKNATKNKLQTCKPLNLTSDKWTNENETERERKPQSVDCASERNLNSKSNRLLPAIDAPSRKLPSVRKLPDITSFFVRILPRRYVVHSRSAKITKNPIKNAKKCPRLTRKDAPQCSLRFTNGIHRNWCIASRGDKIEFCAFTNCACTSAKAAHRASTVTNRSHMWTI